MCGWPGGNGSHLTCRFGRSVGRQMIRYCKVSKSGDSYLELCDRCKFSAAMLPVPMSNLIAMQAWTKHFADIFIFLSEKGSNWGQVIVGSGNVLAPSHYLKQCWPTSKRPYDVIRPSRERACYSWCVWGGSGTRRRKFNKDCVDFENSAMKPV